MIMHGKHRKKTNTNRNTIKKKAIWANSPSFKTNAYALSLFVLKTIG